MLRKGSKETEDRAKTEATGASDSLMLPVLRQRVRSFDAKRRPFVVTSLSVDEQKVRSSSMENLNKMEGRSQSLRLTKEKKVEKEAPKMTSDEQRLTQQRRRRPPNLRSLREKVAGSKLPLTHFFYPPLITLQCTSI